MYSHFVVRLAFVVSCLPLPAPLPAQAPSVKGTFVLGGTDAKLSNVRVVRALLDERTKQQGYAILMSAKPATGDIRPWRSADPAARGSFVFLMLEQNGDVWIAELGHAARKTDALAFCSS